MCQHCLKDWLPAVATHRKNVSVKKGQSIFREGDPVTGIYFIYQGSVKVHKKWDTEKELIVRFGKKGDVLGHLGLGKQSTYPVSATALENSTVCYISLDFLESTLMVNHQLTYNLLLFFANELQQSEQRMRDLAHMPVKGRIARALLTLKEQFGTKENNFLNIEISRQELASFAGVVYETLFKVMNEFAMQRLITSEGRNVSIINEPGLTRITQGIEGN